MAQVDPRVRRQYGARGPLMAQPFQNPLSRLPAVPNPWAGSMANEGPMGAFIRQAAAAQAAGRGQPQQSRPVAGPATSMIPFQNGQSIGNPLQQAFDWANRPQQPDEPRISALLRNGGNPMPKPEPNNNPLFTRIHNDVVNFRAEMLATPEDRERMNQQVFMSMLGAESNNQHRDAQGRVKTSSAGAIGIAQVMPGTAPEAAKLAGLPWDANRYRNDPEYNKALGYAYFKKKLQENNGDYAKAVAAYNAGQGRVQQAERKAQASGNPWQAHVPNETQGYLTKVLGGMTQLAGAFGAPAPGFNAQPYQQAMAAQDQAASLLSKPYSAAFTETPVPDRPTPTEFAAPDFSEGDAAFAATAPKNPFDDPKERRRVQWSGYAKGIGQALASMSGNEGIGTMLMKIGGMALQGRVSGDEKIMARQEEFDKSMQEYNRALAAREDGQAAATANVMNQNIQMRNQQADLLWQDNAAKIKSKNPVVSGDKLITYDKDPTDPNKWVMNVAPLGNAIAAEALLNKSNIAVQMGQAAAESARFAYSSQQATARTAVGYATQMALSQGDGQAGTEGYVLGAASNARAAVQAGTWKEMFGGDQQLTAGLESIARNAAYTQLGVKLREDGTPAVPLDSQQMTKFNEFYEDSMTSTIFEAVAKAGTIDKLYNSPTGTRARITQRSGSLRESERTNAKGQTTRTVGWSSE